MLDFKPETAAEHSDRILKVFENLITAKMIEENIDPVGLKREHVFDSTDGLRIIIGYEDHSGRAILGGILEDSGYLLHATMSVDPLYDGKREHLDGLSDFYGHPNLDKCVDLMKDRINEMLLKHGTHISRVVLSAFTGPMGSVHALFEIS